MNIVYNSHYQKIFYEYPDLYFDWAICDINYGIGVGNMAFVKEDKTMVKQKNGTLLNPRKKHKGYSLKNWDNEPPPPQSYYDNLKRISKNQVIFGVNYVNWNGLGKGRIKWDKMVADGMSFSRYEYAYCSSIDYELEIKLLWSGMMQAKSIKESTIQQGNKKLNEKRIHICQKPVLLYDSIFHALKIYNMKVVDTHIGSGSIRITADKFNCDLIGTEIDSEHWIDQENRYNSHKQQLKIIF